MRKHLISIAALAVGVVALGLAVIPPVALGRPLPFFGRKEPPPPKKLPPSRKPVTLKYKDLSFSFGKKPSSEEKAEAARPSPEQLRERRAERTARTFTIAAVACALLGLCLGPVAWAREKLPALSGSGMACCSLALVWQYVAIGIAAGVAVGIILVILSNLG